MHWAPAAHASPKIIHKYLEINKNNIFCSYEVLDLLMESHQENALTIFLHGVLFDGQIRNMYCDLFCKYEGNREGENTTLRRM